MNTVQAFEMLYQKYQSQEWTKDWFRIVIAVKDPVLLHYLIEYEELEPEELLDPPNLCVYPGTLQDLQAIYLNHFEIPAIVLSLLPRPQFTIALIEEGYEEISFQDEPYVVGPDIHQLAGIHRSKINQMTLVEA